MKRRRYPNRAHGVQSSGHMDINVISSVAGSSITAAYAVPDESLFGSFETNFLKPDVRGRLVGKVFVSWN